MQLQNQQLLRNKAFINGEWINAFDKATFDVTNPFDGSTLASVPNMGPSDASVAIQHAQKAGEEWKLRTAGHRATLLKRWHQLVIENLNDLASLLTYEQGKPILEATGEIKYGASFIEWFAEEAKRVYGDVIPGHGVDKRNITLKQPIGLVVAITPWNFPVAMVTRKLAPALAAGCSIILKPAESTPLSALALAYLAQQAGFPPGVINVITTNHPDEVGATLLAHSSVKKVSFTGSTKIGKLLLQQSAATVKKVSLELGGNAPFIVFKDADIDEAVAGAIDSKYRNSGQTCVCANRIFVHEEVFEEFLIKFEQAVANLKVGNGMDTENQIGPLINEKAITKIDRLISNAVENGAAIITGGIRMAPESTFYEPTILVNVNTQMDIHKEEIFGPVAPVYKFSTEQGVIAMANDTNYGLAAYFYGKDINQVWRVAEALEYGMVGINTGMISTTTAPFGGIKESGLGREGSKYGIDEYLSLKYLCFGSVQ